MSVIEIASIQVRRGQEHQTGIPKLLPGEFGWAEDTENLYIGKSTAEGAVDNYNTRILTEKDLPSMITPGHNDEKGSNLVSALATTEILTFTVTNYDQAISVLYQLTNDYLSRKGTLLINITPTGHSTIEDSYNYVESVEVGTTPAAVNFDSIIGATIDRRFVTLKCTNESTADLTLEYRIAPLV